MIEYFYSKAHSFKKVFFLRKNYKKCLTFKWVKIGWSIRGFKRAEAWGWIFSSVRSSGVHFRIRFNS